MGRMLSALLIMALAACSVTEQAKTDTMQFVPASSTEVGRSNGVIDVDCHQSVFGIADGRDHLDCSGRSETFLSLADATILPRVWANKVGQME